MGSERARASRGGSWSATALFVTGYAITLVYSMGMLTPLGSSPIWIASGVLLTALMVLKGRFKALAAAGCFSVDMLMGLTRGHDPVLVTFINLISLTEILTIWALAVRVCGRNPDFADGRRLMAFLLGAVMPGSITAALVLRFSPMAAMLPPNFAMSWLLNHVVGATVVTPALMVLLQRRRYVAVGRPWPQVAAGLSAFALPVLAVFILPIPAPFVAVVLPMTFALAFVYGPVGAAAGALIVGFVASLPLTLVLHPTSGSDVTSQI